MRFEDEGLWRAKVILDCGAQNSREIGNYKPELLPWHGVQLENRFQVPPPHRFTLIAAIESLHIRPSTRKFSNLFILLRSSLTLY